MQPSPLAVQSLSVADQLAPIARVRAKLVTGCFDNPGAGAASLNPIVNAEHPVMRPEARRGLQAVYHSSAPELASGPPAAAAARNR